MCRVSAEKSKLNKRIPLGPALSEECFRHSQHNGVCCGQVAIMLSLSGLIKTPKASLLLYKYNCLKQPVHNVQH